MNQQDRRAIRLFVIFLIALAISCAPRPVRIDPKLQSYIDMYADYKLKYTGIVYKNRVGVRFGRLQGFVVGSCNYSLSKKEITIDPKFWNEIASEIDREILFVHEMGHCDLDLNHVEGLAIMNAELLSDWQYESNREELLKSFFKETK